MFKTKDDIELVGTAKNGMEVLKMLETKDTDIVITDISMPGMDGIELSERLKNEKGFADRLTLSGLKSSLLQPLSFSLSTRKL